MPDMILRALTQGAYDLQKVRIGYGNRICQAYYQAHGVEPGEKLEDALGEQDKKLLDAIRGDYKRLTDGLVRMPSRATFSPSTYLSSYSVLVMAKAYEEILKAETTAMKSLAEHVEDTAIWRNFMASVRGCGPTMAAVILSRLDPERGDSVSNFWAFAGFDVAPDGRGRSRRKDHLVDREYTDKEGVVKTKKSITYDPWLKTKCYVLATCLLKAGGHYKEVYDAYKTRLKTQGPKDYEEVHILNHRGWHWCPIDNIDWKSAKEVGERRVRQTTDWANTTDGHRHNAAMRYMLKRFIRDLWETWRRLEGLEVRGSYYERKLRGDIGTIDDRPTAT